MTDVNDTTTDLIERLRQCALDPGCASYEAANTSLFDDLADMLENGAVNRASTTALPSSDDLADIIYRSWNGNFDSDFVASRMAQEAANAVLAHLLDDEIEEAPCSPVNRPSLTEDAILSILKENLRLVPKDDDLCEDYRDPLAWRVKDGNLEHIAKLIATQTSGLPCDGEAT